MGLGEGSRGTVPLTIKAMRNIKVAYINHRRCAILLYGFGLYKHCKVILAL